MTDASLTASQPLFKVDGESKAELTRDVQHLEVEESTAGLKTLQIRLLAEGPVSGRTEHGQLYLDSQVIDFGKKIEVTMGSAHNEQTIFKGVISGIESGYKEGQPRFVTVFAEDRLMELRMTRRMKTYENVSDADIARAIASEHGLSARVDADGPTYDLVQQWNMSDLAFLRERARLIQAEIWQEEDALCFKTRDKRMGAEITLVQGNQLLSVSIRADLAHQRSKIKVSGYEASQRDRIEEEAGGEVISGESSGGRTGLDILQQVFGERISYRVREASLKEGECRSLARAEMLRRGRKFLTVSAVTNGTPEMGVGSRVRLERVGQIFEGSGFYVTRVRHTFDLDHGHRTHFEAERSTLTTRGGT